MNRKRKLLHSESWTAEDLARTIQKAKQLLSSILNLEQIPECPKCGERIASDEEVIRMECAEVNNIMHSECAITEHGEEQQPCCLFCGDQISPAHIRTSV